MSEKINITSVIKKSLGKKSKNILREIKTYGFISHRFPQFSSFFTKFCNTESRMIFLDLLTILIHPQKVRRHWSLRLSWQLCLFAFSFFLFASSRFGCGSLGRPFDFFFFFLFPFFSTFFGLGIVGLK